MQSEEVHFFNTEKHTFVEGKKQAKTKVEASLVLDFEDEKDKYEKQCILHLYYEPSIDLNAV